MGINAKGAMIAALGLAGLAGLAKFLSIVTGTHWAPWEIAAVSFVLVIWIAVKIAGKFIRLGPPVEVALPPSLGDFPGRGLRVMARGLSREYRRFDGTYRQAMLDRNRALKHAVMLDLDESPAPEHVYVDLTLAPRRPSQVPGGVLSQRYGGDDEARRGTIWHFLDGPRDGRARVVILGGPGTGKTTLLQHIAISSLNKDKWREGKLPVLLQLREWSGLTAGADEPGLVEEIESDYEKSVGKPPPRGWARRRLEAGGFIVMLDGLDDIASEDDRKRIITWLTRQASWYGRNHYLLTSRPHAYWGNELPGARVLEPQDLDEGQREALALRWLCAVSRPGNPATRADRLDEARKNAAGLAECLRNTPELAELTANPLLLTMTIEVDRSPTSERLPETRADLYAEVCRVLLREKQPQARARGNQQPADKEAVLQELAYAMMASSVHALSGEDAVAAVAAAMAATAAPGDPAAFLAEVKATGIMVGQGAEYRFAHTTLQEYLAAAMVARVRQPGLLASRVDDLWWRETILLYAAKAGADPIVRACLASGKFAALTLAIDCGDVDQDLDDGLRDKLNLRHDAMDLTADPADRKLAAAVTAWRDLAKDKEVLLTDGTHVCSVPVPRGLFDLYLLHRDAREPARARPLAPGVNGGAMVGVTASDAAAFVEWVNGLDDSGTHRYQLPTAAQTRDSRFWGISSIKGHSVWTAPDGTGQELSLSVPSGTAGPYEVTSAGLREKLEADGNDRDGRDLVAVLALAAAHALTLAEAVLAADDFTGKGHRHAGDAWRAHAQAYGRFGWTLLSAGAGPASEGDLPAETARSLTTDTQMASARGVWSFAVERARDLARDVRALGHYVTGPAIPDALPPRSRWEQMPEPGVGAVLTRRIDDAFDQYLSRSLGPERRLAADLDLDLLLCILFARDAESARDSRQPHDLVWGPHLGAVVDSRPSRSVVPEALRRLAREGRPMVEALPCTPDAEYIRSRMAAVAGHIAEQISQPSDRESVGPLLASRIRLRALTVASCACWLDESGEIAQRYVDIAAGITALERRSSGEVPPSEVIVLVRVSKTQPPRSRRSGRH
jgi:hypothetical protein